MRARLLVIILTGPLILFAQKGKDELINLAFENIELEVIIDSLSAQTDYFFSYNSDLFPKGSKYTISAENEPIDIFLSRLLIGTGLKYSFFKDQIILNYEEPTEQVVRRKNFFTIAGKVIDENSKTKSGVNIFLDGTNIGAFSDIDGNFTLESIPPGSYDLVFSHVGYENQIYLISENNGGARIQNHQLVTEIGELDEVEIISERIQNGESDWISHYQIFKSELLGTSESAQQCVIENPEVITFDYDESNEALRAYSEEAIIIRNDALGYRIDYFLESFFREEDDLRFRGKIRFRNLTPISNKEAKVWRRNRKESYKGSFNHFKKSLLNQELKKQGFRIYASKKLSILDKKAMEALTEQDILSFKGDNYELSFRKNLLVEYRKEKESADYLEKSDFINTLYQEEISQNGILLKEPGNQISIVHLLRSPVRIDQTGQILDKFALITYGYWSWERVGDLVPINFDPKWDNI